MDVSAAKNNLTEKAITARNAIMSVVFLAMALLTLIAAYNLYQAWNWMQDEERKRIMSAAEACAEQQRAKSEATESLLRSIALYHFANQINTSAFHDYLVSVYASYSGYLRFEVLHPDGARMLVTGRSGWINGADPAEIRQRFYFREALKSKGPAIGELLDSHPDAAAMPVAMPLLDDARHIRAILVAVMDLRNDEPSFNVMHRNYRTEISFFDRRGRLAYRYPPANEGESDVSARRGDVEAAMKAEGDRAHFVSSDSFGRKMLCAMVKLRPTTGGDPYLYVLASCPQKGFVDFVTSRHLPQIAAAILSFCISLWLAAGFGRRFFAIGLEALALRVREVKKGDLAGRITSIQGCREIQILADGMNSMLDSLEQGNNRLRELSNTDELTGLNNRRHFYKLAARAFKQAARQNKVMAAALADLDHFKAINDSYGHAAGDETLKSFADKVRVFLRETDIAARFGGEEFIILLPDTDQNGAVAAMEKLRAACAQDVVCFQGAEIKYTVSIGIHVFKPVGAPGEASTLDSVIIKADAALYRAKNGGRDQVCRG